MENNNDIIKQKFKLGIAISKIKSEENEEVISKHTFNIRKFGIAACIGLTLITGTVFAKDIGNFIKDKFKLSKGIETAIENGYIEEVDMDYFSYSADIFDSTGGFLNKTNIGIRVNDFMIDDYNLSLEFGFKIDDTINKNIRLDKIYNIKFDDLIIIDEENRILFCTANKNYFNKFCEEKDLDYTYLEFNENYLNCGLNAFTSDYDSTENAVNLTYNMYLEDAEFPRSKELNLYFNKMEIECNNLDEIVEKIDSEGLKVETGDTNLDDMIDEEKITVVGEWNVHLDVPAKMYLREEQEYEVVSCENENFDVYATKLTETGFELGLIINGLENPEYPTVLDEEEKRFHESISVGKEDGIGLRITDEAKTKFYKESPYIELYENYYTKHFPTSIKAVRLYMPWVEETEGCYIQNSNGDKFYISESGCEKQRNSFNEDDTFEFYNKFDMTKYDATDTITAVIEVYGSPVKILLRKKIN